MHVMSLRIEKRQVTESLSKKAEKMETTQQRKRNATKGTSPGQ